MPVFRRCLIFILFRYSYPGVVPELYFTLSSWSTSFFILHLVALISLEIKLNFEHIRHAGTEQDSRHEESELQGHMNYDMIQLCTGVVTKLQNSPKCNELTSKIGIIIINTITHKYNTAGERRSALVKRRCKYVDLI
jgi:hypothetical protein